MAEQEYYETRTRRMSLPQDVNVAQREYERLLDQMLRRAHFVSPQITPLPPENKTKVPLLAGKKPAYTKLKFNLTLEGDLLSLVDFLYAFYRQPLLQQVHAIDILKPIRSKGTSADDRELSFKLTIEALVLDRAEDRSILLPTIPMVVYAAGGASATAFTAMSAQSGQGSPFTVPGVLARGDDSYSRTSAQNEYRRIAGKNIFFDPLDGGFTPGGPKGETKDVDLARYLEVTRVSHCDGKSSAMIFDRFNKHDYEVEMSARGVVKVTQYYYQRVDEENGAVGEIRRKFKERTYLQLGSEEGGHVYRFAVRRILENELLLEPYDPAREKLMFGAVPLALGGVADEALPGRLFLWRVGQLLSSDEKHRAMTELMSSQDKDLAMHRSLDLINEGEGTVTFTGDGDGPPEAKPGTTSTKPGTSFKKKKRN
jgi:hypothetical protein